MFDNSVPYAFVLIAVSSTFACDKNTGFEGSEDTAISPQDTKSETKHSETNTRILSDSETDSPEVLGRDSRATDTKTSDENDTEKILQCSVNFGSRSGSYVCAHGQTKEVTYEATHNLVPAPMHEDKRGSTTVAELRGGFGGSFPEEAYYISLAEHLHPNAPLSKGFAEFGDNVTLHLATIHPRDEYGDSTLNVTLLLNYRPTNAKYKHYNGDRSEVLKQVKGHGAKIQIDGAVELVDVTIPPDAFDEPGRYDLGLGWEVDGPLDFSSNWSRIAIYYGGCTPPSHECLKPGKITKVNETERTIADKYFVAGFVYPGGDHEGQGPFEVRLQEGKRVTVNFSIAPPDENASHPFAVVPMLRDKPLNQRILVTTPSVQANVWGVGYRGSFDVNIPDEPGRYDVEIGIWNAPFLEPGKYPELGFGKIRDSAGDRFGTNDVTYIVK